MCRSVVIILLNHTLFAKQMVFRFYMNLKLVINGVPFCHVIVCRIALEINKIQRESISNAHKRSDSRTIEG